LQSTNLVHYIEKAKFVDSKNIPYQQPFAEALYDLLHGSAEMEQRFTKFCDLLSEMGANKWTIATYYQFLATDGKWMFMKPSIMKRMADSLKIALNYKAEPNWLTYSKLQELADRVEHGWYRITAYFFPNRPSMRNRSDSLLWNGSLV
jgi:hypothetical protein